jgi:hypothetical protein
VYPSHFISGERLAAHGTTLTFGMTATPARIGRMYVTGTDGEVLSARTDNRTYLQFRNDPLGGRSRAKVYASQAPTAVSVNGMALQDRDWSYDSGEHVLALTGLPAGSVLVRFGRLPRRVRVSGCSTGHWAALRMAGVAAEICSSVFDC